MVNEKFRERVPAWQCFARQPEHFQALFALVIELSLNKELSFLEQSSVISFVDNCFNSLEVDCVRQEVMKLCSLTVWSNLLPSQRSDILGSNPKLKKLWAKMEKKLGSLPEEELKKVDFNRNLLWKLLQRLKEVVDLIDQSIEAGEEGKEFDVNAVTYCERLLLLFIDLECQLTTRRFFNRLLLDSHVIVHCSLSKFIENEIGSLSCELLSMLKFYARFEIDDVTGAPLTQTEMMKKHYGYVTRLQKACFKFFRDNMSEFSLLNVGSVDTRRFLKQQFSSLSSDELYQIAEYLLLVPSKDDKESLQKNYARYDDTQYLAEMIIFHCERRPSQLQKINAQPLYPSEKVIWDEKLVPYEQYDGESVLPLNKLNLQFLTIHDYLLRNFNLFQMESTYEVRQDLEDALFRMKPWLHESGAEEVVWGGWARMALPIAEARIFNIAKPLVGESAPAEVAMNVTVNLPKRVDLRFEWESLRKNDVLFLVKVKGTKPVGTKFDFRQPFKDQFEVITVRGCEVEGMLGPDERVIDEMESREVRRQLTGDSRTYRIKLDPNQYQIDMDNGKEADIYFSFNLLVRRDPKANNFKAVLATVRQLLNTELVVPDWLNDVILGYGEPDSAHYSKINNTVASVDFNDTFLSYEHLVEAFPEHKVICEEEKPEPPFALTFKEFIPQHDVDEAQRDKSIVVSSRRKNRVSLFEHGQYRQNHIRFTPAQVEAIKAGMQPGLTMVVGPPGTGKTDVAVQIISNIYHNWPEQRTLIVTHSNQALNQLFEKIIALDVDERHLLRHGEEALETEKDFTRYGRVNYVLKARLELLKEVERLKDVLGEIGDVGYSCETAGYFYRYTVYRNWEEFKQKLETAKQAGEVPATFVSENFPFTKFFEGRTLFKGESFQEDLDVAEDCWKFITGIFKKLEEFRAFELLRNGRDRSFYLLVKEAKIIAMTCTHAALRRKELVELGFRYDNILMEESAQILEVETFIPLLLQDPSEGRHRLKRWIMIGDHHQLPPIVQNVAYQKYANMEQSLFARFIRLGVPYIELDAQGRARDEIARLYNWRYKKLGDLPHIQALPEYNTVNAGFAYNYQLIDVPDFNGVGETTPSPYFYQVRP
ncbi:DEAD box protein helicases superfamily protein (Aquarius) [Aphelenchoides avenae]|nr:DEAD box protein helicases superfamily protein (Aquarius) [Aphelenchus avenae]